MSCDCFNTVNTELAERNTQLASLLVFSEPSGVYPYIATEQIERGRGKAKAVVVFPTYCPFCGHAYRAQAAISKAP